MGNQSRDTVFTSDSGAGVSANDYLQDAFLDISRAPNVNTGFTDSNSTNPFGQYFQNDDAPKYSVKTLWIKDLVILNPKSWVDNKPTYQVIFTENFPGVFCYAAGDVRLRNFAKGKSVDVRNVDDIFGTTGVIRRLQWIVNPVSDGTATADIVVDGVDTTNDVSFDSADFPNEGINKYLLLSHSSTDETKDIHDYRLTPNQFGLLNIAGIVVYYENSTSDIDLFPGTTYVNKNRQTTTSITTQAVASVSGRNGAVTTIHKTASNTYQSTTLEVPSFDSSATGSSGGITIDVTAGHGASFPVGAGVVAIAGTSFYVGSVSQVSTDTLTVGPTLPFALSSNTLYKAWQAGPTHAISSSLYRLAYTFDPQTAVNGHKELRSQWGFGVSGRVTIGDEEKRYRVFGRELTTGYIDGYFGIRPTGFTTSYIQVDSRASAVEIEWAGGGVISGTFSVNGTPSWGISEGFTGVSRKTVFTEAGPGWNSFFFNYAAGHSGTVISKINFYELNHESSVTLGLLAKYETLADSVPRGTISATLHQLGNYQRLYADDMYFEGAWSRSLGVTAAGNVWYQTATQNDQVTVNYFGTDFGFVGAVNGGSVSILFDGASINGDLGVMKSVATLGFHSVVLANQSSSTVIQAFDFRRSVGEITNLQNFLPRSELSKMITVTEGGSPPRNASPGDIWAEDPVLGRVWIYFFNKWNLLKTEAISDDPIATDAESVGVDWFGVAGARCSDFDNILVLASASASAATHSTPRLFGSSVSTGFLVPKGKQARVFCGRYTRTDGSAPTISVGYGDTDVGNTGSASAPTNAVSIRTNGTQTGSQEGYEFTVNVVIPEQKYAYFVSTNGGANVVLYAVLEDA